MERQSDCSFPAGPQSHPFGARNVARKRSGLGTIVRVGICFPRRLRTLAWHNHHPEREGLKTAAAWASCRIRRPRRIETTPLPPAEKATVRQDQAVKSAWRGCDWALEQIFGAK